MKLVNSTPGCERESGDSLPECDTSCRQLLPVLAGDVASSRIALGVVIKINDAGVEWDHVAHLVNQDFERVLDVKRGPKSAGNLVQRINLAVRFLYLVVSNV